MTGRRLGVLLGALLVLMSVAAALASQTRQIPAGERRSMAIPSGPYNPQSAVTPFAASTIVPLSQLPPIPSPPAHGGHVRRIRSANGTTISLKQISGCGGSTAGTFQVVSGCVVQPSVSVGPGVSGSETAYLLAPGPTTPTAIAWGVNQTLNTSGFYVFGAFNTTSNNWDDLLYVSVGTPASVQMYDTGGNAISSITADGSARVTFTATGLASGDNYVVGAESTSVTGQCAWLTNGTFTATATPGGSLCNPANASSSIPAVGGSISATWIPPATVGGTMTVSVWDVSGAGGPVRVAVTQITVIATQFKPTTGSAATTMPSYQIANTSAFTTIPSPAVFAFYSAQEATGGGASVTDLYARMQYPSAQTGDSYTSAITSPGGAVIFTKPEQANGSGGNLNPSPIDFSVSNWAQSAVGSSTPLYQFGFSNSTYSWTLLDTTRNILTAATPFKLVGFDAGVQWLSGGTLSSTIVAPGGSQGSGQLVVTNNGDTLFGPGNSDSLSEIFMSVTTSSPALTDLSFNGSSSVHSATANDSSGNAWTVTITAQGPGFTIDFVPVTAGTSLAPNATITTPTIYITNKNNSCNAGCTITTQIKPVHGSGKLSLDPLTNSSFNLVNTTVIENGTMTHTLPAYGAVVHVGYVGSTGGAVTIGADAHRYNNASRTQHGVYAAPDLGQSASGYYDVWRFDLTANGNGDAHDLQLIFPPAFNVSSVLQSSQLTGLAGGTTFTAQKCSAAPGNNYLCFSGGTYGTGTQSIYFALAPPATGFSYQDVQAQVNNTAGYQSSNGVTVTPTAAPSPAATIYDDQYLASVDALSIASYTLDSSLISALLSPSSVGQNKTNYPVTFQVTNSSTSGTNYPDYLDAVVVDVADQGSSPALAANGASTPAGWSLSATTTSGAGGTRRYWFSVCPTELTPNDTYGPTASAGNGSSVNAPLCSSTAGWKAASLAPASSVQIPLVLTSATSNIPMTVYFHGANGGGWSKPAPLTEIVSAAAAGAGFSAAGGYGGPSTVGNGTEPQIGLASNSTYGDSFVYQISNTGNAPITSFAITIPGKDVSGVTAYDGTHSWQITSAPVIQGTSGSSNTYGCALTQPAGASGSYVSASSTGQDGHIFVSGCSIPVGASVQVAFSAYYPQTINETYRFGSTINWTTFNSGTNATDGVTANETWFSDQLMYVTTSTSLIVYVPNAGTTTYPALTPANTSNPNVNLASCGGCQFLNSPNTLDFNTVMSAQSKNALDSVLVRVINANAPNGWKLYVSTNYNLGYSGGGSELQTAFDSTNSTSGVNLHPSQGGTAATFYDIPTTTPGLQLVDNNNVTATQSPYDMLMSMQVRVGTETQTSSQALATVTYTWIAN